MIISTCINIYSTCTRLQSVFSIQSNRLQFFNVLSSGFHDTTSPNGTHRFLRVCPCDNHLDSQSWLAGRCTFPELDITIFQVTLTTRKLFDFAIAAAPHHKDHEPACLSRVTTKSIDGPKSFQGPFEEDALGGEIVIHQESVFYSCKMR
jgi:hypothetical protein